MASTSEYARPVRTTRTSSWRPVPASRAVLAMIASFAVLESTTTMTASAYTSYSAVPHSRQIRWLQELTDDFCSVKPGFLSDEMIESTHDILKGWASAHRPKSEHVAAAESVVKRLVDEAVATGNPKAVPTTSDYNCLLASWARSGAGAAAAERCESILNEMTIQTVQGDLRPKPDLGSYKAVLMAWRHSHVSYSAARAQRVLEHMLWSCSSGTNRDALPDADCFDIVLQNWATTPLVTDTDDATSVPQRAERLLGAMERWSRKMDEPRIAPRTSSFNAVLSAWFRHGTDADWRRAVDVLGFMQHLHDVEGNDRVRPDGSTYFNVLSMLSKYSSEIDGCAPKADQVLRTVERNVAKIDDYWKPDKIIYNLAIGCWAKSNASGCFRHARSLLERQWRMHKQLTIRLGKAYDDSSRPDVIGYTSVISSCASESGDKHQRREAFDVAAKTYQELLQLSSDEADNVRSTLQPNHVTFGVMLKACTRLLPQHSKIRRNWAKNIFRQAILSGQVGPMVLSRMEEAVSAKEFRSALEGHPKNALPVSWTCKVHDKVPYQRKYKKRSNPRQRKV